jgi:hypothetical protein
VAAALPAGHAGGPSHGRGSPRQPDATPEQFSAKYRWDRDHAQDGPAFSHLKRAHPHADDGAIKQAIMTAVKFEDACFRYFEEATAEYWQRCLRAVARARKDYPGFLESTYQQAANDVAYYYK